MNRNDVTREQAAKISKGLYGPLNYLGRLKDRMVRAGFPPMDPLFCLVVAAFNAVHHLSVEVHYLSCGIGDGSGNKGHLPLCLWAWRLCLPSRRR
jgi:hypothetical protein